MKKLILLVVISACGPKIVEPVIVAKYFVTNATNKTILLSGTNTDNTEFQFLDSSLSAGEKAHIYTAADGSGGSVTPSRYFATFVVYSDTKIAGNIIYSKVDDSDWKADGIDSEGNYLYHLTINIP